MKYTLSQARENQDEAKRKADEATDASARRNHMNDVLFWTGYMAAMIDHDYPQEKEIKLPLPQDFLSILGQGMKLGGSGIMDTKEAR